jgi:hypothetical protein
MLFARCASAYGPVNHGGRDEQTVTQGAASHWKLGFQMLWENQSTGKSKELCSFVQMQSVSDNNYKPNDNN